MTSKARPALTDEYLRSYSVEHLWYEIFMFFRTGSALPGGVCSPVIPWVDNAVLESFAIHLRNLLDFFYSEDARPDDVIAADYYDAGRMPSNFPAKSSLLLEAELKAHKQVSHLTTKRLPPDSDGKRWYPVELMADMAVRVTAFTRGASARRLDPNFVTQIEQLLASPSAQHQ